MPHLFTAKSPGVRAASSIHLPALARGTTENVYGNLELHTIHDLVGSNIANVHNFHIWRQSTQGCLNTRQYLPVGRIIARKAITMNLSGAWALVPWADPTKD